MGTSTETAVASHPPSPDVIKDWEKLKRVMTLEKQGTEKAEASKPPPALEECRPSSEDESRLPPNSEVQGDRGVIVDRSAHESPTRRGIWDWARAGTGRLSIIGRLPHPEWKGPASASKAQGPVVNHAEEHGRITGSHDDFEIPSATATEPNNIERQQTAAAARIEGLGISSLSTMMSPNDFSQTKRSSDDLIANASETTGSPSPQIMKLGAWTNGDDTTPTTSKPTSPVTPDTPTPSQRRSDSIMEAPTSKVDEKSSTSDRTGTDTEPRASGKDMAAETLESMPAETEPNNRKTSKEPQSDADEAPSSAPAKSNGSTTPGQRRIPTYKIALASSLLSPVRRSTSAAH